MQEEHEIWGLKIAPAVKRQATAKYEEKLQKRQEHQAKVLAAKQFFQNLETMDISTLTTEQKLDLLLNCFIHAAPAWANMENVNIDVLGNPFKER